MDDGSKDSTYEILCNLAKEKPLLEVLTKSNSGHGATVLYGYRHALENGADFVFQTDSDGQTDPHEFEQFWANRNSYDAQFGNRTERADGKERAFVEKALCRILRHYFGVSVPDANAPFRLMSSEYLAEFLPKIPEAYNLPNVMLTTFGAYYHKRINFIPISFGTRQFGTSSINFSKIIKVGLRALKDFDEFRGEM